MNFPEYLNSIKDIPVSDKLEYHIAVLWLHPGRLPLNLVSIGDETMQVIKVPERTVNPFSDEGIIVPVTGITKNAFCGKETVTDIILPASIENLSGFAFAGCRSLRNITIPKRIKIIREGTFAGCTNLENIYYEGSPEDWEKIEIVHRKHAIDFGDVTPGTPVQQILAERYDNIPGNEAVFSANIHFHCRLSDLITPVFQIKTGGRDMTELFRLM